MCERCDEYKALAEVGRQLANERDQIVIDSINRGEVPPRLEVPEAPVRPRCKGKG